MSKPMRDESLEGPRTQVRFQNVPVEELPFGEEAIEEPGQIRVGHLATPPESVAAEYGSDRVVSSVEIAVPEGVEDSPVTIRIRISESELGDWDPGTLLVVRVVVDENQRLQTDVNELAGGGYRVVAETQGFSTFSVVSVDEEAASGAEDDAGAETSQPSSAETATEEEPGATETQPPATPADTGTPEPTEAPGPARVRGRRGAPRGGAGLDRVARPPAVGVPPGLGLSTGRHVSRRSPSTPGHSGAVASPGSTTSPVVSWTPTRSHRS